MVVFGPRWIPLGRWRDLLESLRFTTFRMKDYRPTQASVLRRIHPRHHILEHRSRPLALLLQQIHPGAFSSERALHPPAFHLDYIPTHSIMEIISVKIELKAPPFYPFTIRAISG